MASINKTIDEKISDLDKSFHSRVATLVDQIMMSIEEGDSRNLVDLDYSNEVLTIEIDSDIYVINKQSFLREVWLSSPISGPHHFSYKDNKWKNSQSQDIYSILSEEISNLTQQIIRISE